MPKYNKITQRRNKKGLKNRVNKRTIKINKKMRNKTGGGNKSKFDELKEPLIEKLRENKSQHFIYFYDDKECLLFEFNKVVNISNQYEFLNSKDSIKNVYSISIGEDFYNFQVKDQAALSKVTKLGIFENPDNHDYTKFKKLSEEQFNSIKKLIENIISYYRVSKKFIS